MTDKGHLDPNPIPISKEDVINCLNAINGGNLWVNFLHNTKLVFPNFWELINIEVKEFYG